MSTNKNLLIEIGTEELPANTLNFLASRFAKSILEKLVSNNFYRLNDQVNLKTFASPRRITAFIQDVQPLSASSMIESKGPPLKAAIDSNGNPTAALQGFAKRYGIEISQLEKRDEYYFYRYEQSRKTLQEILPEIITQTIKELPIPKPMRWSDREILFSRPIQWITILFGDEELKLNVLGFESSRLTYGHRFHHPQPISLSHADEYESKLREGFVIVNFDDRKKLIQEEIIKLAEQNDVHAIIDDDLLNEVTGLVEWPVPLIAEFDSTFLSIPKEALMTAMQHHQRSFPLVDQNQKLISKFITISNIKSKDPKEVILGNERVMRARLSDAQFFYETDRKQTLENRLENLKNVVFQTKLGNLFEKSQRISHLAKKIIDIIDTKNSSHAERAGILCKADLVSTMVGEFPELQGIMGYYYAENDGENSEVAVAIRDHYLPRFANDKLPQSLTASAIAIADRIDTLVGIFGNNQQPTGDKDPFGLRRAALGVLRILIEKELNLDLKKLFEFSKEQYKNQKIDLPNKEITEQLLQFMRGRLSNWYEDKGITADIFDAVACSNGEYNNHIPLDIHHRILAVKAFQQLPESTALAAANKRVRNLLVKTEQLKHFENVNPFEALEKSKHHLKHETELKLYNQIILKKDSTAALIKTKNYTAALSELASLKEIGDQFFDTVLVMDEDQTLRDTRLTLLAALRFLFTQVADISTLQK
jgi:glycyl-tRNA synthetase beta chain